MILRLQNIVLLHKVINKPRLTKKQNSAHRFRGNYLTNHPVKFLQHGLNPEELELLEYALVINFLKKIVSEDFPTSFNFSRGSF